MTTHDKDKIIAAAKEAGFPEWENTDDPEFLKVIEKLYVVAFQSGAASRDAEVAELQKAIDENWVTHQQIVAARKERDQLRDEIAELVAALETVIPEVAGGNAGGNAGLIAYNKCKAALAKVLKPT